MPFIHILPYTGSCTSGPLLAIALLFALLLIAHSTQQLSSCLISADQVTCYIQSQAGQPDWSCFVIQMLSL